MGISRRKPPVAVSVKVRQGFTLVELLVVIAVIGILLALLLPAVQSARESGRKTACMSNAYQLGMAVNRYDQDKGRVPCWQNEVGDGPLYVSWAVMLLPYIERNDLYDQWSGWNVGDPNPVPVRIGLFQCASSPPAASNPAPLAYAGNSGDGYASANTSDGVMQALNVSYSLDTVADGDGTATTLLFAEKAATISAGEWESSDFQSSWTYPSSTTAAAFTFQTNQAATCLSQFPAFGQGAAGRPTSSHVGGWVVTFCDGHTYFLRNDVDGGTYANLVTSKNSTATAAYRQPLPLDDSKY